MYQLAPKVKWLFPRDNFYWPSMISNDFYYYCWGPSASEGPQKHDLTMFLEYNV
jgi:hypothetical protein